MVQRATTERALLATTFAHDSDLDGVRKVIVLGEQAQQVMVRLDPQRLEAAGVSYDSVVSALAGGGLFPPDGSTLILVTTVQVDSRYRTREDIAAVVVRRDGDGDFITIGDLIDAADSAWNVFQEPRRRRAHQIQSTSTSSKICRPMRQRSKTRRSQRSRNSLKRTLTAAWTTYNLDSPSR